MRGMGLKLVATSSRSDEFLGLFCPKKDEGLAVRAMDAVLAIGEGLAAETDALDGLNDGAVGRNSNARTLNLVEMADVGVSVPRGLETPDVAAVV